MLVSSAKVSLSLQHNNHPYQFTFSCTLRQYEFVAVVNYLRQSIDNEAFVRMKAIF